MAPLVSVVVPVYNVSAYLEECLDSILAQTWNNLEVIVIDDGSTDDSPAIAARYAERDPRVRLVSQPNGGLGHARNVGVGHARGEFLCFVDSDDVVPFRAYELMHAALAKSGSDFATGNFRRLTSRGTRAAKYVGTTYSKQRLRTHIRDHRDLVVDRTAGNKLFRRTFWDKHEFHFAEGVQYEDQYVTLPAHFLAESVDVVSSPIYFWRIREQGELSISQRREEPVAIRDRLTAIAGTSRFLVERGFASDKPWYEQSVLAQDLGYFLDVVVTLDDAERLPLLDQVDAWLDQAQPDVFDRLPAIRRVGWHLARRRALDELDELLRFERDELPTARPVRRGGEWYGDYPFFRDRAVGVPDELYRLDDDLAVESTIHDLTIDGKTLRVAGRAVIAPLGVPRLRSQRISVAAVPPAPAEAVPLRVEPARVPGADRGAGFAASLDVEQLVAGDAPDRNWRIEVTVDRAGTVRSTDRHDAAPLQIVRAQVVPLDARRRVRAELDARGGLVVHVERPRAVVREVRHESGQVVLTGTLWAAPDTALLEVTREAGRRVECPAELTADGDKRWSFRVPIPLVEAPAGWPVPTSTDGVRRQQLEVWDMALRAGTTAYRLTPAATLADEIWTWQGEQWLVEENRAGQLVLVHRTPRPTLVAVHADPRARRVTLGLDAGTGHVVLADRDGRRHPLEPAPAAGDGVLAVDLARAATLEAGTWDLLHEAGPDDFVPLAVDRELLGRLPLPIAVGDAAVTLGLAGHFAPVVTVH
jgi:CDP-glycerol glycerophosphotransferase